MKKSFYVGLVSSLAGLFICNPAFSVPLIDKSDVLKSEEYNRKKAEIRYTKVGNETIREVYINGFRVNDQNLASLVNDKELSEKIGKSISNRRTTWGATVGLGLPVGSLLIYLAASNRATLPVNNTPAPLGQISRAPSVDFKTFALGTLGALVTLYAVSNSVSLLNDITGLNSPQVLKDKEAENAVKKYNENLQKDIFTKISNNLNENTLSSSNNNIMILNISKSF